MEKLMNPEKDSVDKNVVQQNVEENVSQNQNIQQNVEQSQQEKGEDPNWKAFREARKKDRIEKEEAQRKAMEKQAEIDALKAAMEAAFAKNQVPQPHSDGFAGNGEEETEDERIEKKVKAEIERRENERRQQQRQREEAEYPQRLRRDFPDFDQVIGSHNLDYLEYHYPEVVNPLKRLSDGYEKWSDVYKAIKKFVPNNSMEQKDLKKSEQNLAKPKSMSTTSITPSGQPEQGSRLSDERKSANWERMQKMLKGIG
jgi:hypothetical protein